MPNGSILVLFLYRLCWAFTTPKIWVSVYRVSYDHNGQKGNTKYFSPYHTRTLCPDWFAVLLLQSPPQPVLSPPQPVLFPPHPPLVVGGWWFSFAAPRRALSQWAVVSLPRPPHPEGPRRPPWARGRWLWSWCRPRGSHSGHSPSHSSPGPAARGSHRSGQCSLKQLDRSDCVHSIIRNYNYKPQISTLRIGEPNRLQCSDYLM